MAHFSIRFKAFEQIALERAQRQLKSVLTTLRPIDPELLRKSQETSTSDARKHGNSGSGTSSSADEVESPQKTSKRTQIADIPFMQPNPAGIVHIPKSRSLFTVLSGPHVHKKSREQFEMVRRSIRVEFEMDRSTAELFYRLLKNMYFTGCQLSVRVKTRSYLLPSESNDLGSEPVSK